MQQTLYLGLGHYSRTGKTSFAKAFTDYAADFFPQLSVKTIPFASNLKNVAHQLYGWAGLREEAWYDTREGEADRDVPLEKLGGLTPVDIWVKLGTNAIRDQVWQNTWVDLVLESDHDADIVITPDVRFPSEVDAIRDHAGLLWKIVRPGYGPRETVADQALVGYTGWDATFGESGDFEDLLAQARASADVICSQIKNGGDVVWNTIGDRI